MRLIFEFANAVKVDSKTERKPRTTVDTSRQTSTEQKTPSPSGSRLTKTK